MESGLSKRKLEVLVSFHCRLIPRFFFFPSTLIAVKMSFISFNCLVGFGFGVCVWEGEGGLF